MTGTAMEIISWLSQQKDGQRYEISLCKEKRSLNQNSFYWEIVSMIARSLKKPDAYVHNLLLRRCEIYEKLDGKVVCISLPDTDEAELWVEYNEDYHYKPTLDYFENSNGTKWRWYKDEPAAVRRAPGNEEEREDARRRDHRCFCQA